MSCPRRHGDRGDTLLEVLIAVAILGIAAAAIMGGFSGAVAMSSVHSTMASADIYGVNYAEAIEQAIDSEALTYTPCAPTAAYATPPGWTAPPGYAVSLVSVQSWGGSAWLSPCVVANDAGVQRLTVTVTGPDTRAAMTVHFLIRKPCTLADVTAGPCS